MPVQTFKLNGIPYAAKDVEVAMLGRISREVVEINFTEEEEVEDLYVLGTSEPVDATSGKKSYKGDVTILVNGIAGIEIAADGSITTVERFPITVALKALPVPLKITLDRVKFTGKAITVTAGSATALAYKCPIHILGVSGLKPL